MKKKIVAFLLCTVIALTSVSCGARSTVDIDSRKTTLTVANYNGGLGTDWLNSAIDKFEEKYADYSFEEGKKGVQVVIGTNNKTTMGGNTLKDLILSDTTRDEVFFTEGVLYPTWVEKELMLDITEYVEEPLTDFGENKSIADKMYDEYMEALRVVDDKIYALPFWQGNIGFIYNATLFDENGWYVSDSGGYTNVKENFGAGPDGKKGTYDDGMPATYDDFFALLAEIKKDGATPLQIPGAHLDYLTCVVAKMAADKMGYDQFMLNYTFDGTAMLINPKTANYETMEFDTEEVEIDQNNAYELARQPGIAYGVKFAERLMQNIENYDPNKTLSGSFKLAQAQLEFVRNPTQSSLKNVAITTDGTWWEGEAAASFKETYGAKATKHDTDMDYKVMPFPKATVEDVGKESIMVASGEQLCFIKSNIAPEKIEVATKFLQFVHTDAQMREFTEFTSMKKPYNYELDKDKLTVFAQSAIELEENSRLVVTTSDHPLYRYSPGDFNHIFLFYSTFEAGESDTMVVGDVMTRMANGTYQYSTEDYFNGIYKYRKNKLWKKYADVLNK